MPTITIATHHSFLLPSRTGTPWQNMHDMGMRQQHEAIHNERARLFQTWPVASLLQIIYNDTAPDKTVPYTSQNGQAPLCLLRMCTVSRSPVTRTDYVGGSTRPDLYCRLTSSACIQRRWNTQHLLVVVNRHRSQAGHGHSQDAVESRVGHRMPTSS
jgi:hypothetical protein